jgi:glyoxylase I family protein
LNESTRRETISTMAIDIQGLAPLLQVFDMPASVHFYRDVLGFELVTTSSPGEHFDWALLRLNRVEVMLNTAYESDRRPPSPDSARVAAHSDTALYFGCEDLDPAYRHLRAHGFNVKEPVTQSYGMRQLYVTDPDGYTLCFQWPATQQAHDQWRKWYGVE